MYRAEPSLCAGGGARGFPPSLPAPCSGSSRRRGVSSRREERPCPSGPRPASLESLFTEPKEGCRLAGPRLPLRRSFCRVGLGRCNCGDRVILDAPPFPFECGGNYCRAVGPYGKKPDQPSRSPSGLVTHFHPAPCWKCGRGPGGERRRLTSRSARTPQPPPLGGRSRPGLSASDAPSEPRACRVGEQELPVCKESTLAIAMWHWRVASPTLAVQLVGGCKFGLQVRARR